MKTYTKTLLAALAAITVAAFSAGCGGGGGATSAASSTRTGNIKLTFKVPGANTAGRSAGKIPSATAKIEIEVEGDGLAQPIEQYVTDITDTVTVELSAIPIGTKQIMIAALDSTGQPLAATVELVDVLDQKTIQLRAELGVVLFDAGIAFPSAITLAAGETLNVKNMSKTSEYSLTIPGVDCPPASMSFGPNSQLACTFTTAGTYTLQSNGSTITTVTVTSASGSIFKADASSSVGYGAPPLEITFAGRAASSSTSSTSYSWNFGDGSTSSSQTATHTFSAEGDYLVTLTATSGSTTSTDYVNVHIESPEAPSITAVSPSTASNSAASTIMLTGADFQSGAIVSIGASEATNVTVLSSSAIYCTVPAGIKAGTYDITVTNPDGQTATIAAAFTVTGTSAATYSLTNYFPINTTDTRVYIESDGPEGSGMRGIEKTETVSSDTVGGKTCYNFGSSSYSTCFSIETDGLYMHRMIDSDFNGTTTATKTITFSSPLRLVAPTFSIGDSITNTVTYTESSTTGQTNTGSVTVTMDVLGVEPVSTPAGYFPNAIKMKYTVVNTTENVTETDYVWYASGVGEIKDIHTDPTDTYCTNGCPRILLSATVGGTSYPSSISPSISDGDYWGVFLNAGTTPASGFKTETISSGVASGYGLSGTYTAGDVYSSITGTSASTFYSNGTFTQSSATAIGTIAYDGSARAVADYSGKYIRIYARKGASYTSSMFQGGYFGATMHLTPSGEKRVSFMDFTVSGTSVTFTENIASSTGGINSVATGAFNVTLAASGTLSIDIDPDMLLLAGENGDIILMTKHAAGERMIGVLIRKGSTASLSTVTGPFLGVNLGYETTSTTPAHYASLMALDITSAGTMDGLDIEGAGSYHLNSAPITVGADGRIYPTGDTYLMIGTSYNGKWGIGVDLSSLSLAFVMRSSNATTSGVLRQSYPLWF